MLELIWESHKPLGAYQLMDMLALASTRRVAPPTVYRALDFLLEQGLVHRINGLNAFIGCPAPGKKHQSHFLICRHCGVAVELNAAALTMNIQLAARNAGFSIPVEIWKKIVDFCSRSYTAEDIPSEKGLAVIKIE